MTAVVGNLATLTMTEAIQVGTVIIFKIPNRIQTTTSCALGIDLTTNTTWRKTNTKRREQRGDTVRALKESMEMNRKAT